MIITKNMYILAVALSLNFFTLHAKSETIINAITNNPDITCTLEPLTDTETIRLFYNIPVPGDSKSDIIFDGYDILHAMQTNFLKQYFNKTSNLFFEYQPFKVTITNSSSKDISIEKPNESYLKCKQVTFESKYKILDYYESPEHFERYFSNTLFGGASLSCLAATIYCVYSTYSKHGITTKILSMAGGLLAGYCTTKLVKNGYNINNNIKAHDIQYRFHAKNNLLSHLLLNDRSVISAGSTVTDIVFINKAKYSSIGENFNFTNEEPKLLYNDFNK